MKNQFLFIALTLLANYAILQAQNKYFERTYMVQGISEARNIFPKQDGTYVIIGNTMSFPNLIGAPFYLHINEYGDTLALKQYLYANKNTTIWDAIETQYGYALAICQPQTETSVGCRAFLMRLTHSGDLISLNLAGNDTIYQSWGRSILQTSDNGYIMAGLIIPGTGITNKLYVVKLKADSGTEWEKVYDYFPYHNSFRGILHAPGGGYYAIASIRRWVEYSSTFPLTSQYIGDILLYKLDDLGNVEWQRIYFEEGDEESPIAFCQAQDNTLYIAGAKNIYEEMFITLNESYDITACLLSGENTGQPSFISTTPDGNLLISGVSVQSGTDGYIKKISPSGSIKWKRIYGDAGHDYFYTHQILPDGSIILGGRNDMSSSAAVYIVKTNCMGLLTQPQAAFSYEAQGGFNNLVSFTNLSQYVYADSIDGGKYIWDWGDGSIPSVFGTEAFTEVYHYYPSAGAYPVTLYAIVCQDTSMVQALVHTHSGSGTVGTQTPPRFEVGQAGEQVVVYPNPAGNTLFLNATHLTAAHVLTISLYTPQGQLAKQHTAPGGATLQLATHTLPSGIYYCHIQVNGQAPQIQKIAIIR